MMTTKYRPRRTMLYVTAHNARHLEKSRHLPADTIIFDLQESVPPKEKENARKMLEDKFSGSKDFGYSERVLRVNPLDSKWFQEDLKLLKDIDFHAVIPLWKEPSM